MTDGNMAIQVSPVLSEGEMKSFQDMFGRIANTITRASELDVKVTDLIHKVDDLSHNLEVAQARNSNLDETLLRVRTERDELSLTLSQTKAECSATQHALSVAQSEIETGKQAFDNVVNQLTLAKHDRDDAQFQVLTLTEELDKAKAALASIHAALNIKLEVSPVTKSEPVDIIAGSDTSYLNKTYPTDPVERSEPVFVGSGDGFQPEPKPAERLKLWQGELGYSSDIWYAAKPDEYGYDQEKEQRWHYADAKVA